ncbi:2,5-dioxovalerate dehydrogenase [Geothrix limicola]|uniref:2,5-dioxovalerate dehydrogenase n=1 Tax=Geothrix limicola TaxID=2927978 RepID=A0ABQ5QBE6_9BACT|nr:aldehyde dehydrogenase (NADP(+)) [Geothrix limicola]GLH71713.1 2,5-dioxovalerate dehydrogenase [Geothrix limicola]
MLQGLSLLGSEPGQRGSATFQAVNPATGEALEPLFHSATEAEVDRAVALAQAAAPTFGALPGSKRAALLRAIAEGLEAAAPDLVPLAMTESGLPEARVRGELGRTCFQLRLFADVAEEGSWVEARLDKGDPARAPLPKPDLRSALQPLGPVAVFGASNFPLAFGALGGDTASALAAGCPVVAKAHPLNPGTSELVARVTLRAIAALGLPSGTFSLLFDGGHAVAARLVRHPAIRAVGFTGSYRGGKALLDHAASRPEPIPVYAEMGSANPLTVLPAALSGRGEAIAKAIGASVLNGVGQFCTCPGLVVAVKGPGFDAFRNGLAETLSGGTSGPMLGEGIARAYREGRAEREAAGATLAFAPQGTSSRFGAPALLETSARTFLATPSMAEEVFGPLTLLVACEDEEERRAVLASLSGQLTATLWTGDGDEALAADLLPLLSAKAGRVLFNGVPTGVEVGHAMVHGGPWPATSAPQTTSVGTRAISRWARPVCYQDTPEGLLPPPLRQDNPLGLWRLRDGVMGKH